MSDTLQEGEDQIVEEEANEREIRRIRRARLGKAGIQFDKTLNEFREKYGVEADYCDECKGRPHAPWCSLYRAVDQVSDEEYGQLASSEAPPEIWVSHFDTHHRKGEPCNQCSEHEPAARGGGEEWSVQVLSRGARILAGSGSLEDKTIIADHLSGYIARQIVTEHNQYQSLVAERERLIIAAKAAVERLADLPRYLEKNGTDALATMTAECLADLAVAIPAEQRSTSA